MFSSAYKWGGFVDLQLGKLHPRYNLDYFVTLGMIWKC